VACRLRKFFLFFVLDCALLSLCGLLLAIGFSLVFSSLCLLYFQLGSFKMVLCNSVRVYAI
jgi:hypothetical protein